MLVCYGLLGLAALSVACPHHWVWAANSVFGVRCGCACDCQPGVVVLWLDSPCFSAVTSSSVMGVVECLVLVSRPASLSCSRPPQPAIALCPMFPLYVVACCASGPMYPPTPWVWLVSVQVEVICERRSYSCAPQQQQHVSQQQLLCLFGRCSECSVDLPGPPSVGHSVKSVVRPLLDAGSLCVGGPVVPGPTFVCVPARLAAQAVCCRFGWCVWRQWGFAVFCCAVFGWPCVCGRLVSRSFVRGRMPLAACPSASLHNPQLQSLVTWWWVCHTVSAVTLLTVLLRRRRLRGALLRTHRQRRQAAMAAVPNAL